MFRNMVTSLFKHERIRTTDVKAKELRRWADDLITLAKRGDLHARRQAMAIVREKDVVHKLFSEAAERFGTPSGGYTRIVKLGRRPGDAAPMSIIELISPEKVKKKKTRKKKKVKPVAEKKQVAQKKAAAEEKAIEEDKTAVEEKTVKDKKALSDATAELPAETVAAPEPAAPSGEADEQRSKAEVEAAESLPAQAAEAEESKAEAPDQPKEDGESEK